WARLDARFALSVHVGVVNEIAGHQIDRSLDPFEISADDAGEGAQQGCLPYAYVAFEKNVTTGEQRDVDETQGSALADDGLADFSLGEQRALSPVLKLLFRDHCDHEPSRACFAKRGRFLGAAL